MIGNGQPLISQSPHQFIGVTQVQHHIAPQAGGEVGCKAGGLPYRPLGGIEGVQHQVGRKSAVLLTDGNDSQSSSVIGQGCVHDKGGGQLNAGHGLIGGIVHRHHTPISAGLSDYGEHPAAVEAGGKDAVQSAVGPDERALAQHIQTAASGVVHHRQRAVGIHYGIF